jgi:hypothetical protein
MSKSKQEVYNSFDPEARKKARGRAMIRAILIAASIEAPLLFLAVWFMPVDVMDASGQAHIEFRTALARNGAKPKMEILLAELLAIAMIPTSAVLFTIFKYR